MSADEYEEEWEEDWDEEEWEEEEPAPSKPRATKSAAPLERRHLTGMCLGYLAMFPLIAAYELAVEATDGRSRNTSELLIFQLFSPLGEWADPARWAVLAGMLIAALIFCFRRGVVAVPAAGRVVLEGALGALVIGPLTVWSFGVLGDGIPTMELHARMQAPDPTTPPTLSHAALVFGGAAYEEILFRVLAYGLIVLLASRFLIYWSIPDRGARIAGEAIAFALSSLLFAALHLQTFLPRGWTGGEEYDPGVFAWRVSAGVLLCALFRWRGPGVAAWTHGLFNLALLLGAGPEVLL